MELSTRSLLEFACDAAWQAGHVTLRYFQTGVVVDRKADQSPVTIADRESEQLLRKLIGQYWPDHSIIGEEFGGSVSEAGRYKWILDPIDGTKSFIHGVPLYSVLIGLIDGDNPLVGIAYFPALGEMICAARGEGCFLNSRRVHVSTVDTLRESLLLSSEYRMENAQQTAAFDKLVKSTQIQRTWGDSYGYALVATGRAEIMLDPVMNVWDNAPFPVILEEAGGTFTDWTGKADFRATSTIATNGTLFNSVMSMLNEDGIPWS